MKKLFTVVLTLLTCGAAYALPLGNPSEASLLNDGLFWERNCSDFCEPCSSWCDAWSLRVGFYGDYVFDRHLEVVEGVRSGNDIEDTEIFTNAGYIAFNMWDRFDIFATVGATNLYIQTNAFSFQAPDSIISVVGNRIDIETTTNFSWSVGGRITLFECGCTSFGVMGQYFRTNLDVKRVTVARATSFYLDDSAGLNYREWQVGLGVSHRIWKFVPYFGAKYSRARLNLDTVTLAPPGTAVFSLRLQDLETKKHGGLVVGVSLVDCDKIALTVEGRWPDENAIYVNGQIRF